MTNITSKEASASGNLAAITTLGTHSSTKLET